MAAASAWLKKLWLFEPLEEELRLTEILTNAASLGIKNLNVFEPLEEVLRLTEILTDFRA